MKQILVIGALVALLLLSGCRASMPSEAKNTVADAKSAAVPPLAEAMAKLGDSIRKPASSFHVSFAKSDTNGTSYKCDADISPTLITGTQTAVQPVVTMGSATIPASTTVTPLNVAIADTSDWNRTATTMQLAYLNGHIGDGQAGVRAAGEEMKGGFDTRRFDLDLASAPANAKAAILMAGNLMGGTRRLVDYNVKGSAWVCKEDGRMVKFSFDYSMKFSNGETDTTHYEGEVSRR